MKKLMCVLCTFLILSCGKAEDGTDGSRGPQGPSGPGGKPGDQGEPGKPAEPGDNKLVVSHVHCDLVTQIDSTPSGWPKFELSYEKTVLNDESALVVLSVRKMFNELSNASYESHARFYVKAEAGYNLAMVESTLWKAELAGPDSVKFSYKPSSLVKTASCK